MDWDDKWIIDNWPGMCTTEFTQLYSKHVGLDIKKESLRKHIRKKLKLKNTFCNIDDEIKNYIIDNYEKIGYAKMLDTVKERFGEDNIKHVRHIVRKYKLNVPKETIYKNLNLDPPGTINEQPSTGYLYIKLDHGNWELYHKYLYEQAYGKISKDKCVIFLDNNNRNFNLSNLVAIPKIHQRYLNMYKMRSEDPDITKTAILWCQLHELVDK